MSRTEEARETCKEYEEMINVFPPTTGLPLPASVNGYEYQNIGSVSCLYSGEYGISLSRMPTLKCSRLSITNIN